MPADQPTQRLKQADDAAGSYWHRTLSTLAKRRQLPVDVPGADVAANFATLSFEVPSFVVRQIQSATRGSTLLKQFAFAAAVQICLLRYGNRDAQVTAIPSADLNHEPIDYVALVDHLDTSMTFDDALRAVQRTAIDAHRADDGTLASALRDDQELREVVDIAVVLTDAADPQVPPGHDVVLMLTTGKSRIEGRAHYRPELYREKAIRRFCAHMLAVLESGFRDRRVLLRDINLVRADERRTVLQWSDGDELDVEMPIDEAIRLQAQLNPERIAITSPTESVSYRQIEDRATQLATWLRHLRVAPGDRIAVCLSPGADLAIALLAALKVGAAYVPLDPEWPADRLSDMLEHSQARYLVASGHGTPGVRATSAETIDIRDVVSAAAPIEPRAVGSNRDIPACVIYTSGSTGQPKGVCVSHGALSKRVFGMAQQYDIRSTDRLLQFISPSADAFGEEIYPTLLSGATLIVHPRVSKSSPLETLAVIQSQQITVLHFPVAYWSLFASTLAASGVRLPSSVRLTIAGGEAPSPANVATWLERTAPNTVFINAYGPTEGTIGATSHALRRASDLREGAKRVPIGAPLPATRLHVLDADLNLVPPGVSGEIYVAGPAIASGYFNDPAETALRFVPEPLETGFSGRMYRTGDRGSWLDDGELDFLGRADEQIKIRGHRVEPSEVEAAISAHPLVRGSAVVSECEGEETRLVAYIVPRMTVRPSAMLRESVWDEAEVSACLEGLFLPDDACIVDASCGSTAFRTIALRRWPLAKLHMPPSSETRGGDRTSADAVAAPVSAERVAERGVRTGRSSVSTLVDVQSTQTGERLAANRTPSDVIRTIGLKRIDLLHLSVDADSSDAIDSVDEAQWPVIAAVTIRVKDAMLPDGYLRERLVRCLDARGFHVRARQTAFSAGTDRWLLQAVRPGATSARTVPEDASAAEPLTHQSIVNHLRRTLPDAMIPSTFYVLDAFPMTPMGKVDKRALQGGARLNSHVSVINPRDTIETQVNQLWQEILGEQHIGVRDDFFAVGGHSLRAVALAAKLEQTFGSNIPVSVIFDYPTVEQQAAFIRREVAVALPVSVVPLRPQGTSRPLFCVHPAGGLVQVYSELARVLDHSQPLYGLQSYGLAQDEQPLRRVETMAGRYIADLRAVQREGPYHIVGLSMGSVVAYEMAVQLAANGEQVAFLGLLDGAPEIERAPYDEAEWDRELSGWVESYPVTRAMRELGVPDDLLLQLPAVERLRRYVAAAQSVDIVPPDVSVDQFARFLRVFGSNSLAHRQYIPTRYEGPVTLIRTAVPAGVDHTYGWGRHAPNVTVHELPGPHAAFMHEPHIGLLAALLEGYLRDTRLT